MSLTPDEQRNYKNLTDMVTACKIANKEQELLELQETDYRKSLSYQRVMNRTLPKTPEPIETDDIYEIDDSYVGGWDERMEMELK